MAPLPQPRRSLSPRQQMTGEILASLDARADKLIRFGPARQPKQLGREWEELRRRMRDRLAANASGEISAADLVADLYLMGWDR